MTRLLVITRHVEHDRHGIEVRHHVAIYDGREQLAKFEYDPRAATLTEDFENLRLHFKPEPFSPEAA